MPLSSSNHHLLGGAEGAGGGDHGQAGQRAADSGVKLGGALLPVLVEGGSGEVVSGSDSQHGSMVHAGVGDRHGVSTWQGWAVSGPSSVGRAAGSDGEGAGTLSLAPHDPHHQRKWLSENQWDLLHHGSGSTAGGEAGQGAMQQSTPPHHTLTVPAEGSESDGPRHLPHQPATPSTLATEGPEAQDVGYRQFLDVAPGRALDLPEECEGHAGARL